MNTKNILVHSLAFAVLTVPFIVSAHCDSTNSDGGCAEPMVLDADGHAVGASALLKAGDPRWFGLMAVSLMLMSALSYLVYRYVQVAPYQKPKPPEEKK